MDLNNFILNNNENTNNILNEEPKMELISVLMMRFIFYSHLFFRSLLGKLNDETFTNNYTINEGYTCLRMLISLWEKLNSNDIIPGNETNKVEIFLNRVNKEIVQEYKLCKDFNNKDNVKIYEESFNKYIIKCRNEYEYYKLIYVDKTMKAIIQENNFPLSYEKEEYPFIKYFVLISNPNIEDLKLRIKDKIEDKKLFLTDSIMNYDEKLKEEKFNNFINNNKFNQKYLFLSNLFSLSPNIYKNKIINCIDQKKEIIDKYKEYFTDFIDKKTSDLVTTINSFINNLIGTSMKFLGKYIDKLKNKNFYLYKNIRRPILAQYSINCESIIFDISRVSKYKSYPHLLSKYIYKDIFMEEKEKPSEFIDLDIKIDYCKYKEFDIDIEAFEDELNSIILPNKRLFYDKEYNIKIIYSFDSFRGININLLSNFIVKYKECFEDINCQEKIRKIINEPNIDIISIFIEKIFKKYEQENIYTKIMGNKKYEELDKFNQLIIEHYNNSKNGLIKILGETFEGEIKQRIVFNFIINVYFNLLKIINYLIDNLIPGDISLIEIITNLPDMLNISEYSKIFFKSNKDYKLKHLYSIFEQFEKYLFPFILLHVYEKYKTEHFDENKENILNYFAINKDKIKETIFTKRQLIDALRKFISRYLASSDIDNEYKNKNEDGEDIPTYIPLIYKLKKNDLWPFDIYFNEDKIENGLYNLKEYNFLVKHSVDLYQCLSGISFDDNGKVERNQNKLYGDESENEYNFYKDIQYFNNKNILSNSFSLIPFYSNKNYFNQFFIMYNLGNIYLHFINIDKNEREISLLAMSNSNNGLYCSKWKINEQLPINPPQIDKNLGMPIGMVETINQQPPPPPLAIIISPNLASVLKKENSIVFNNNNLADIQNLTCLNILKENEVFCFGTNNAKLKIIKLKDNFSNIELIQEINLKNDSVCVNSIVQYNQNKTLIISDEKHILVFENNEEDINFSTYIEKKDINTGNKTYIIKIDEHTLAAFIYPNIVKFYNINNYEFGETVINDIKADINLNNQKQFKMMNLIGKNKNILGICSNEHSIYLIDINEKKLIKNCTFEGYNNNFVSIIKYYEDYVLLLDSSNNLILTQLPKKEKIEDLNFVALLKKLGQDSNFLLYFPFGICHAYFDGNNITFKYNELN